MGARRAALRGMNKLQGLLGIALALCLVTGCSRGDRSPAPSGPGAPVAAAQGGEMKTGALAAGRSLVVTMEVGLNVADVDASRSSIRGEVERAGGYVADASSSGGTGGDARVVHMELRVPANQVAGVRAALGRFGEVTSDVEKVQDVTEEHADLEARLHNARTSEKRILEIMSTKTGTITEVIDAEKEVSRIRESIERMESQKHALDGRIDLATVRVTLSGPPGPSAWQTPGKSIAGAARGGLRAAAAAAVYATILFVTVAPIALPIAAIALALRARRRAQRQVQRMMVG